MDFTNYKSKRKFSFLHIDLTIESILSIYPNVRQVNLPAFQFYELTQDLQIISVMKNVEYYNVKNDGEFYEFFDKSLKDNIKIFLYSINETPTMYDPNTFEPIKYKIIRACIYEKNPEYIDLLT
jgi:hypothetical protein